MVRGQGRAPGTEDRSLEEDLTLVGVVPQAGTLDAVTAQESQRWLDPLAGPRLFPREPQGHKPVSPASLERRVGAPSWELDPRRVRGASRAVQRRSGEKGLGSVFLRLEPSPGQAAQVVGGDDGALARSRKPAPKSLLGLPPGR